MIPRDQLPKYEFLNVQIEPQNATKREASPEGTSTFSPIQSESIPIPPQPGTPENPSPTIAYSSETGEEPGDSTTRVGAEEEIPNPPQSEAADSWTKFFEKFSIDQLEEIFGTPTGGIEMLIKQVVESKFHMTTQEFIDHFTNFEEDFIRILGFLFPHILNEAGQAPAKLLKENKVARFYGHVFLNVQKNAQTIILPHIITDLRDVLISLLTRLAPEAFIENLKKLDSTRLITLFFEGAQKAWQDLGVPFAQLKPSLTEEFQEEVPTSLASPNVPQVEDAGGIDLTQQKKSIQKDVVLELMEEMMGTTTLLLSIPVQLTFLLSLNMVTGISELFSMVFMKMKDSSQRVVELLEKAKK